MFWKGLWFQLQSFLVLIPGIGQQVPTPLMGELHQGIDECSGIVQLPSGEFAVINDSGNPPCVFFFDSAGTLTAMDCPVFLENKDWEDLAFADSILYIGDFGNNQNRRRDLRIYRVKINDDMELDDLGSIEFSYGDQKSFPPSETDWNYDVEAMVHYNDSLYLFTKNRTSPYSGYVYLYRLPASPGEYVAYPIDSLQLGSIGKEQHWVTGAALNSMGDILVLLGYDQMWLCYDFPPGDFFGGAVRSLQFDALSQKEAVCFTGDSTLVIADERHPLLKGGRLYRVALLSKYFRRKPEQRPVKLLSSTEFQQSIELVVAGHVKLPILWEMYSTSGERVAFGKVDTPPEKEKDHLLSIDTGEIPPGGYVLSIIIDQRPYPFKLKKLLISEE